MTCLCEEGFPRTQPQLSAAVLGLQWWSLVVPRETTEPKMFTACPFTEKVCRPSGKVLSETWEEVVGFCR